MNTKKEYHTAHPKPHRPVDSTLVYCGREGFLSITDMVERTAEDIKAYAKMQPLRFRNAMLTRRYNRFRILARKPLHSDHLTKEEVYDLIEQAGQTG